MTTAPAAGRTPASPATGHARRGLERELGLFSAAMIVVGGIIGGGIFFTPAVVARALPSAPWILGIWVAGGLVALAGALTYAELGAMLPDAGGPYVYIREAFGQLPAFLYGWMVLASIATAADAAVAVAFAQYAGHFIDLAPLGGTLPLATAAIVLLTATNYLGVRPGAAVQNALTVLKIAVLALLIAGGLILWGRLGGAVSPAVAPPPPQSVVAQLAAAFVPVLFTIGGWQQMNMVAGEIRDPQRNLPRALALGIAIVIVCYIGANAVYVHALGRDGLAVSTAVAADTAERLVGPLGATLITLAAMLSFLGIVNVIILTNPRVLYALSRDGAFFPAAARIHPRFGTPYISIAIMGVWTLVLLWALHGSLDKLLSAVVFPDWIFFGLGGASVFVLRRTRPHAERPYRVWGYPVVPALFVLAALAAVASAIVSKPGLSALGFVLLMLGLVVYLMTRRRWTPAP
ncbi:MAG TPA: amino acid permease [Gemmatimonadaceae bacterium]|nr:amino acid permease [Gemmatimonadaceae bacterium]